MKLFFIEWKSFGNDDIKAAFRAEGHEVVCYPFDNKDGRRDSVLEQDLAAALRRSVPDVVFSFNYFPVISNVCKREDIRYISWIYDSPYVMLYSYTVVNPCNTIYIFDRALYQEFHDAGIQTVQDIVKLRAVTVTVPRARVEIKLNRYVAYDSRKLL